MREHEDDVRWYRRRIHQKQREAASLSIEVGLKAQDKEDPSTLARAEEYLDNAIQILEEARTTLAV